MPRGGKPAVKRQHPATAAAAYAIYKDEYGIERDAAAHAALRSTGLSDTMLFPAESPMRCVRN
jgi:hypothetical protein